MALTYGFFNSVNGDRKYDADQISNMFEGLISDGVYESVGDAFVVTATNGMTISVGSGRAIVDDRWVKNDAAVNLTLNAAHVTLKRYTAIVLRKNITNRLISLQMIDGTPASNPVKPSIVRNATTYDICLAYVYVDAGATTITQANITDTRANTNICGWVTGLIQQVDTSELFLQWQNAYESYYNDMTQQFNQWFEDLTDKLQVDTYINRFTKRVVLGSGVSNIIPLNMTNYTYATDDIVSVYINGLYASENYDWLLDTSKTPPEVHVNASVSGTVIEIVVLKSKIGSGEIITTLDEINGEVI